ncbi:MAG: long-chain fatty acid--CoA ligase [Glaciimonas sp.]|nr:long-chain fatty acid--CoA ligase [Glaciimonas sp.]
MDKLPHVYPTVVHMLAAAAKQAPQREALVCQGERLTYAEYLRCVAGFAHELLGLGTSGRRVGIVLGNSIDICIAMFGVHAARAQAAPFNPLYTEHELRILFRDADLHVLIYAQDKRGMIEALADELAIAHRICIGNGAGGGRLNVWRDAAGLDLPQPLPAPADLATLQYTGGTTGRSKGVDLRHHAVAVNLSQREALLPARQDCERLLCVMPLFHVYAVAMCLHNMAYARGTLVMLPRYTPEAVFEALAQERITIFAGSPTLFSSLLNHQDFGHAVFTGLHLSYSGSAALPEDLLRRWEAATGVPVMEGYGQTEAGPVVSFNPLDSVRKLGSVGLPLPGTEVEIVDLESGRRPLDTGKKGEIRVRGPQLMAGYRNLPEETDQTLRDGWLYTGDIGELDGDGYLYIRDRKKEMAKVSGFNVFPREIEEVLYLHPGVGEAAAVAVPDAYRGEVITAFVAPRPGHPVTAEQLTEHCKSHLAKYKVPAQIFLVAALPKTGVGKIDKNRLRETRRAITDAVDESSGT